MNSKDLTKALKHLKREPKMAALVKKHKKPDWVYGRDPFEALSRSIIYQQLSGKAAATIYRRFTTIYGGKKLEPKLVARTPVTKLRAAGLSNQKASYILDLAKKFLDGTVDPIDFHKMTDEEIRTHVIAVKGIGRWTADMFLMFTLHRPDVLPTGDLGIQKAMQRMFKLKKLPSPDLMERLTSVWSPYRTVACRYLWDSIDTTN